MGIETAIIAAVAIAGAATAAQQSHAGQVHAAQDQRDAVTAQNKLQHEAMAQDEQAKNQQTATAMRARQRALAQALPGGGRSDVLTNPLGNPGQAMTAGKTALGL